MISDFARSGERALRLGASLDLTPFGAEGLGLAATWVTGDTPDAGRDASPDQQELNFTVDYQPPVTHLERFWLRLRYAKNDRDAGGTDIRDFRVILNYGFTF